VGVEGIVTFANEVIDTVGGVVAVIFDVDPGNQQNTYLSLQDESGLN